MKLKSDLVSYSRLCYKNKFLSSTDGNLSVRTDGKYFYFTPTNLSKINLKVTDVLKVDIKGNVIEGKRKLTTEFKLHKFIYENRADVNAVIHTHPVFVTAFACAGLPLDKIVFPEVYVKIGKIPLAKYATPSTDEVPQSIAEFVHDNNVIMLENHGLVTFAKDLCEAYHITEKVERIAEISFYARMLGGEKELTKSQIKKLELLKKN
jgi:L-fuculose-phosphate aldolase